MAKNIFRTAFDRVIEARERQVRRYVNGALLSFDDETLKTLGRRREDMVREGSSSFPF
ncbi:MULTISPECIES: hypothetical protein [Rhizobiaceae]|jgi:hypothetical protein|uniref:hypothetical protein n=1 Tax=Rhizobiaceae TaxID=82115 RepID=UPI001252A028|nr:MULTISPECIES: hypothetical protein [Rhizobiaceae]GLQ37385.1 hypothetical protein GCM10007908_10050 [Rhizobium albus]VVT26256.1 Aminoglycoside phosphotransferase [Rhizobium sp. EC-SD404]